MSLNHKIGPLFSLSKTPINGDPAERQRPRQDREGRGEVTDVCLKRKIRDRLRDAGKEFSYSRMTGKRTVCPSLRVRAESDEFGVGKAYVQHQENQHCRSYAKVWHVARGRCASLRQVFAQQNDG